jgi:hypothetical protein
LTKNCQIHICDFHCVAKHIEGWLWFCTFYFWFIARFG